MSSVVDQLVDMGFERARAEYAFDQTGKCSLEAAVDWLINHNSEEVTSPSADQTTLEASKGTEALIEVKEHILGSYKCDDCNKLLRDENTMALHAAKSGHENFSESSERLAPLTPEERAKKAAELREKIKGLHAHKEEQERREQIEKERRRREEGKKMLETRERQKENELRAVAEERRREKLEEAAARQRVLEQIKADRVLSICFV